MPQSNNPIIRYNILDQCFRRDKTWSKDELLQILRTKLDISFGQSASRVVSESMLRNDIAFMRDVRELPIEEIKKGKKKFYYYSNRERSFWDLPLKEKDVKLLTGAVGLLKQLKGFEIAYRIGAIVNILEHRIRPAEPLEEKCIFFEDVPPAAGIENLEILFEAIVYKNVLKIVYKPFSKSVSETFRFHPFFLKEYNNRWYLFGWNSNEKRVENRALDRMIRISVTSGSYIQNECIDPRTYFNDMVGVTRSAKSKVEEVLLEVKAVRAPYLISRPLHQSQVIKAKNPGGSIVLQLNLIVNRALLNLLLFYGPDIKVLSPVSLVKQMKKKFLEAAGRY